MGIRTTAPDQASYLVHEVTVSGRIVGVFSPVVSVIGEATWPRS